MESCAIYYWRIVFQEFNTGYLAIPTCDETHLVHTIVLDLEDLLVFHTPAIWGHKTLISHMLNLLLVHVSEFFTDCLSPF